jgi:hypothetical protein
MGRNGTTGDSETDEVPMEVDGDDSGKASSCQYLLHAVLVSPILVSGCVSHRYLVD